MATPQEMHDDPTAASNSVLKHVRIALQQRRATTAVEVTRQFLESAEVTEISSVISDRLLYQISTLVLGERIQREIVVHEVKGVPINWWQAWKELYAPPWYLRRWPVVRHSPRSFRIDLSRWAHYPHAAIPTRPDQLGKPVIVDEYVVEETSTGLRDDPTTPGSGR